MARKNKGRLTESLLLAPMLTAAVPLPAGAQPDGATDRPETDPGHLEHAAQEISRQIPPSDNYREITSHPAM